MKHGLLLALGAMLAIVHGTASAQFVPMDFSMRTFNSMNIWAGAEMSRQGVALSHRSGSKPATTGVRPISTVTQGRSDAARQLAASFPAPDRAAAERTFGDLLVAYGKLESSLRVPQGDAGAAVASLVIGSYEAYHGRNIDPAWYGAVIDQVRGAMARNPGFAQFSAAERRALYEQMAILGMVVITVRLGLASRPDAATSARLRDAAAGYLRAMQLDPTRLSIGAQGLTVGAPR